MAAQAVCGIVFLDKPSGWTSRRAVNEVARIFSVPGEKRIKAGHAGTLDPLATGMLPVLLGDATRFADLGLNAEKSYRVSFDLSYQSNTLDREGEITARFDARVGPAQLQSALAEFRGAIEQVPPQYSAIRIDGKRAHDLARRGQHVEMAARPVTVHRLDLLAFDFPLVTLQVSCSKGAYIRALARDIGAKLGAGGCVTDLRRLSTGGWPEAMMVSPDDLATDKAACLLPLAQWLRDLGRQTLSIEDGRRFLHGQRIQLHETSADAAEEHVAVFSRDILLGTGLLKPGLRHMVLHPAKIMPSAQKRLL